MASQTTLTTRRLDPERQRNAPLKAVAAQIARLSFRDMQELASIWDAKNEPNRSTADRFLAVADEILGPDFNPHAPMTRGQE